MKNATINMPEPNTPPPFNKAHIDDYMVQTGWVPMPQTMIKDAAVYWKDRKGVVFMDDSIMVKECPANGEINGIQILMNWESVKYYKGWDGRNLFHMMMLLDFMGVVRLCELNKQVRKMINMEHLLNFLPETYGVKAELTEPLRQTA